MLLEQWHYLNIIIERVRWRKSQYIHDDVLLELIILFQLTGRPMKGQDPVVPEQQVLQEVIVLVYQSVYGIGCIIW